MSMLGRAHEMARTLTDLRHRLHRRPELGLHLPATQAAVLEALDGLGLEISTGRAATSVTAVLRGGARSPNGRVVLLRADMDALPVTEQVDSPFRSEVDGAMHACGHDLHTAMLVGAARLLAGRREQLPGDVVFMFQPGEEGFEGARHMIDEGVLDAAGRRADAAFAVHVMSNLGRRGMVATRGGALMAASAGLRVVVRGAGGHASSPHLSRDPLPAACEMVLALPAAVARSLDPFAPHVLTVATFHAGSQRNVIGGEAVFEASVRTLDPAVSAVVAEAARRTCQGIAAAHGVEVTIEYAEEYPVTVNSTDQADFALGVAADLFGQGAVFRMPNPIMGSEDFSRVLGQVPGAMLFLGAVLDGLDPMTAAGNHSPAAAFDDGALPLGAALYAELAARSLAR